MKTFVVSVYTEYASVFIKARNKEEAERKALTTKAFKYIDFGNEDVVIKTQEQEAE